ncbi:DNA cytosine methyltransferase [Candidatus Magnetominusculus dajiuhuensis]|uniref:DNA cytosine methyltransferase n=1 Tax=Candidatus Magnetominusculus dajiuhuensis TaxID=3137712 RepID=UPI003B432F5F
MNLTTGHICCGAGGDILGAKLAGARPQWGFDLNAAAVHTAQANHPDVLIHHADMRSIQSHELSPVDMIICGIPCQPFTSIGKRQKELDTRDITLPLIEQIIGLKPKYLLFENVREYRSSESFQALNEGLSMYDINWQVINYADYGIPQRRLRLFGLGKLRGGIALQHPKPTHTESPDIFIRLSPWVNFGNIRDGADMRPMSAKAINGVFSRRFDKQESHKFFSFQLVEDTKLCPTILGSMCSGSGCHTNIVIVYDAGRLRHLSFLEARRAQGFPDDYMFCGNNKANWLMVANAIPPSIAKIYIESIAQINSGY